MIRGYISLIRFSNGLEINLHHDSVLVLIGPNNSGKSTALAEIELFISGEFGKKVVLEEAVFSRQSTVDEIKDAYKLSKDYQGIYRVAGAAFRDSQLDDWWSDKSRGIGEGLTQLVVSKLDTRSRLSDCDPPSTFDSRKWHAANHPFQRMYIDAQLEEKTSEAVRRAFKSDLIIHRGAGQTIPAYIGKRPKVCEGEDRISPSYLEKIAILDEVASQGDGIRSYVSIVSRVISEQRAIQLIDEPEAFLHPPQAKLVGEIIALESGERQTFIATHSNDILQGLLISQLQRVSVVRLVRKSDGGRADLLTSLDIEDLWRDPILRFGGVLDGLFHDGVVVTEADGDCRFYAALMSASVASENRSDLHYTYGGGKDRIPVLVKALICLKVPVATIVDFDVLNSDFPLRRIIEAHGGEWEMFKPDWDIVKRSVEENSQFVGGDEFRSKINDLLASYPSGSVVPRTVIGQVRKLARNASPWDNVKNEGVNALSPGLATKHAKYLLSRLRKIGIFVNPHGQMEGFCRTVDSHGPRWVEQVLQRDLDQDAELSDARAFVTDIADYFISVC